MGIAVDDPDDLPAELLGAGGRPGLPRPLQDDPRAHAMEARARAFADKIRQTEVATAVAAETAACAELVRAAEPLVYQLLREHHWDMNRPEGGTQTRISQERFAAKIAKALAAQIEARGKEGG